MHNCAVATYRQYCPVAVASEIVAERWVPLIEFTTATPLNGPLAGRTNGTVNPGVVWVSRYLQVAGEAIIPMDAHSGRDVGARIQAHLFLPAIFPEFYSRPVFGK